MKKSAVIWIALLTIGAALAFSGCVKEPRTPGMLTVRVINDTTPVPWERVYLATSLENMKAQVYFQEAMTSETGYAKFDSLEPGLYWYDTEHWDNFGAVEIYYNIDTHVILRVTNPAGTKE